MNERDTIHGFCEYLIEERVPEILKNFKSNPNTIPIRSSECE
jgi:hypothetical protein